MSETATTLDTGKIRELARVMEQHGLSRLVLTEAGVTIRLEAGVSTPVVPLAAAVPGLAPLMDPAPFAEPPVPVEPVPAEPDGVPLTSPTTGSFYRSPGPGEATFVEVGDTVEVGQTVGIIMAMKVMSEVPAEVAGEVVAIPAEDGALVQAGEPLIVVRPTEA